jgi:cyclophilin family peptidyl-prolyl cis-trans isomerase
MHVRKFFLPKAALVSCLLIAGVGLAQDEPPKDQPAETPAKDQPAAPAEAAPSDAPASEEKPAEAPKVDPQEAAKKYQDALTRWKDIIKRLREIKTEYQLADRGKLGELTEEWKKLTAQGREMIGELRQASRDAFVAAPNQDRDLARMAVNLAKDALENDLYEEALAMSEALIAAGHEDRSLHDVAGSAAFALDQFDKADEHLRQAASAGSLSDQAQQALVVIPEYKRYWAEEQKVREEEAQADDLPRVRLTTTKGEIVVELFENQAPDTVGNFVSLVEKGFYDGLAFHRVLPNFMAQGGDPKGDGSGGPGYEIYCEWDKPGARRHFRGTLSMAHAGKNTGGSQFFITFRPTPHLNNLHTAFGRVIEGEEVLAKLQRRDPGAVSPPEPDRIEKAEVIRKRDHEYKPNKVE